MDGHAFEALVCQHLDAIVRFIRYHAGNGEHVEDLVQETLIQAWRDLPRLRERGRVKQWLLGIARNRCRDFLKQSGRREVPTEDAELEFRISRLGPALPHCEDATLLVVDAMQDLRPGDRELLQSFYLRGDNIAEIAAREGRSEGTVKRQLFGAREHLREAFTGHVGGRGAEMSARKAGSKAQPFPRRRPEIGISASRADFLGIAQMSSIVSMPTDDIFVPLADSPDGFPSPRSRRPATLVIRLMEAPASLPASRLPP